MNSKEARKLSEQHYTELAEIAFDIIKEKAKKGLFCIQDFELEIQERISSINEHEWHIMISRLKEEGYTIKEESKQETIDRLRKSCHLIREETILKKQILSTHISW